MNLLKRFRAWRLERQRREIQRQFNLGRITAMQILRVGEHTPRQLYGLTETAELLGVFDDFDRGVRAAIAEFEEVHEPLR